MKIFLSSTGLDLKEYRDKVRKAIEESGNEFVGMETFGSHSDEPTKFCPDKVEECDVFAILVAYRYGFVPDEKEGLSITRMEYHHAGDKKIPVRVYLTDKNQPWTPSLMDENLESVNEFRALLLKNHTCSFFTTPDDLYEKVSLDIGKFPEPMCFKHPYMMQENFTGREKERGELTDWLTADTHPMLVCQAIGGMGKSALVWQWLLKDIKGSEKQRKKVMWWSFYDTESRFERFIKCAIEYFSDDEPDWTKLQSTRDRMDFLYEILSRNKFLLVLDGAERVLRHYAGLGSPYQSDEIREDEKQEFRTCIDPNCGMFLRNLTTGNPKTKTLLTSRLFPKELDESAGVLHKELTQMDKKDAVDFFEQQGVKGMRAEIEEACNSCGYHPLYLRLLSGMIVKDPKCNGDIIEWKKFNPLPKLVPKEHHILELAYNALDKDKQTFLSKISAFRNPMDYESLLVFNTFYFEEKKIDDVLNELTERGLLLRDKIHNKFDLHPIVRRYCYDKLIDKETVHYKLMRYFAEIQEPEKVESVDDLAQVIELYHHTVRAGRYDEAENLFYDRLHGQLWYRFGAYQTIIELLRTLFPDGEDKLPRLKKEDAHIFILNEMANSYTSLGQPRRAVQLLERANKLAKKQGNKKNLAICLSNLALNQIQIGELDDAESNLRRRIEISREIKDGSNEVVGHLELGRLLAYRRNFKESRAELTESTKYWEKTDDKQGICLDEAYHSICFLLMSNADEALKSAKKSRELANVENVERDIIRAEYLLGAAYLMKKLLPDAETHLIESLTRDRKINMVDLEPDILLEFAKLRFRQDHKDEALKHAREALGIADRCEYRLAQADIHNFLAEFYFNSDAEKAREHAEIAAERASSGYVPALEKAQGILNKIKGI